MPLVECQSPTVEPRSEDLVPFFAISGVDHVINTRDKNFPIRSNQLPQEGDEVSHGFMHGSAKDTRVQITSWTADFDEHVYQTAETISDARGASVEPVVIRLKDCIVKAVGPLRCPETYDADSVYAMEPAALSPGVLYSDELVEAEASALLHPFEDEAEVHGKFNTQILVSLKDVEPS